MCFRCQPPKEHGAVPITIHGPGNHGALPSTKGPDDTDYVTDVHDAVANPASRSPGVVWLIAAVCAPPVPGNAAAGRTPPQHFLATARCPRKSARSQARKATELVRLHGKELLFSSICLAAIWCQYLLQATTSSRPEASGGAWLVSLCLGLPDDHLGEVCS